ncbi:MAG: hypothetical protein Q4A15_05780 [Prevotellaceae bacterium]|nr:hypothetical protein [Prevotellaceae bacterium]
MFDFRTRRLLKGLLCHPARGFWRLARTLDIDFDREGRDMLVNSALGLPDRVAKEYEAEINWLQQHGLHEGVSVTFPYPVVAKQMQFIEVEDGVDGGVPYVYHKGKRLFFPPNWKLISGKTPKESYRDYVVNEGILGISARAKTPHSYITDFHHPGPNDVLLDVGCAEALFALDWVDRVQHVHLFECDKIWRRPLRKTFLGYQGKVTLTEGFVGDGTDGSVRLDDCVRHSDDTTYFVKMDIEGAERFVLNSSAAFLKKNKVALSVCCYHRYDDYAVLTDILTSLGYSTSFSDGYMLPEIGGCHFPYFRKGVIYAKNY